MASLFVIKEICASKACHSGLTDRQWGQNNFFVLANNSMAQMIPETMLLWVDSLRTESGFHPLGHVIQPLKEIWYQ